MADVTVLAALMARLILFYTYRQHKQHYIINWFLRFSHRPQYTSESCIHAAHPKRLQLDRSISYADKMDREAKQYNAMGTAGDLLTSIYITGF